MSAYQIQRLSLYQQEANGPKSLRNVAAPDVPFFTPAQDPAPGTAIRQQPGGKPIPKLFTPLQIRDVKMPNRICVSPMCQYSCHDGFHTPWHIAHYGGIAQRGPGLLMVEATAVQANGRITPEDSGIWLDAHMETLKNMWIFAHSQNSLIGIQLSHAGRKASTVAPWLQSTGVATKEVYGWPDNVFGPTDVPFSEDTPKPRAMTLADIQELRKDFVSGAQRAIRAGFDVIELHFAHGYLVSTFLTPAVNQRSDKYGGSFENRTRLALEIVEDLRAIMPSGMPLFVRISATDWLAANPEYQGPSWSVEDSAKLALLLAERGVDVLDVSSGGTHVLQKPISGPGYQAGFAKQIKETVGNKLLVSSVGNIKTGELAEQLILGGKDANDTPLDLIAAARPFQKNPGLVLAWADDLDVAISVAHQIGWGFRGRSKKTSQNVV